VKDYSNRYIGHKYYCDSRRSYNGAREVIVTVLGAMGVMLFLMGIYWGFAVIDGVSQDLNNKTGEKHEQR